MPHEQEQGACYMSMRKSRALLPEQEHEKRGHGPLAEQGPECKNGEVAISLLKGVGHMGRMGRSPSAL